MTNSQDDWLTKFVSNVEQFAAFLCWVGYSDAHLYCSLCHLVGLLVI